MSPDLPRLVEGLGSQPLKEHEILLLNGLETSDSCSHDLTHPHVRNFYLTINTHILKKLIDPQFQSQKYLCLVHFIYKIKAFARSLMLCFMSDQLFGPGVGLW